MTHRYERGYKLNVPYFFSGVFQKIHESFDEIDSEKMYPFYVEKESSLADCDYGERKGKAPLTLFDFEILLFLKNVENVS